jgi:hypothetical protein
MKLTGFRSYIKPQIKFCFKLDTLGFENMPFAELANGSRDADLEITMLGQQSMCPN